MVDSYFGGMTVPASCACNRATRPCSRSTSAMYRTPGSFPDEGGFSPRFEGAPSTVRCCCGSPLMAPEIFGSRLFSFRFGYTRPRASSPSEMAVELRCRNPAARASGEALSNDRRVSDSILITSVILPSSARYVCRTPPRWARRDLARLILVALTLEVGSYNPEYSFFAATSMGKSASAFFQISNSASYAFFAFALSPAIAYARASPSCAWA
jgi:hypothetical protein